MSYNVEKRFLALLLAIAMVLSMMPSLGVEVHATTNLTGLTDTSIGLSYENGTWTASGTTVEGEVQSTTSGSGCSSTINPVTSTLTITNNKGADGDEAVLSFDYVLTGDGTVVVAGETATANGSYSTTLAYGESITIQLTSSSEGTLDTTITLSNIQLYVNAEVTTTFGAGVGGSYTVASTTNGTVSVTDAEVALTQSASETYTLTATANSGYQFFGWCNSAGAYVSYANPYVLTSAANQTIYPVFVDQTKALFGVGTSRFFDLNDANTYATTSGNTTIVLLNNGTLPAGDYTISNGVTLLIPFDEAHTLYTTKPGYIAQENGYTPVSAFRTLTMAPGATITVNGAISVSAMNISGQTGNPSLTGAPTGNCGFINMQAGSKIDVNNGGFLYAWGYIVGDGAVTANYGATVYESMQVTDYRGGSATTDMLGYSTLDLGLGRPSHEGKYNGTFVFSQYYVQNIEVPLTIHYGAVEYAGTSIYLAGGHQPATIRFIGLSDGVFAMDSGSNVVKKYDGETDRLVIDAYGSVYMKGIELTISRITANSQKYVLPINSNMTINVHTDSSVTIQQDVAMLPGAQVNVERGATIKVAEGYRMYLYDADQWDQYEDASGNEYTGGQFFFTNGGNTNKCTPVYYAYSRDVVYGNKDVRLWTSVNDLTDVCVDLNGTIIVEGALYTTKGGAQIISSGGTGAVTFSAAAGTETHTYQVLQVGSDVTMVYIPITAAKLLNANGTYTETAGAAAGTTYYWNKDCQKWVKGVQSGHSASANGHYCTECGVTLTECVNNDSDHDCDLDCGNTMAVPCEDKDKDHYCDINCGATFGEHVDANLDHKCDYGCTEAIGTHEDTNKDHNCDYGCTEAIGTHEDTNKDHICDYGCAVRIGSHLDENGDHFCDYGCGQAASECVDTNKDHICDYNGCGNTQVNWNLHIDKMGDGDHLCDYSCGATVSDCVDEDPKDHKCDECGTAGMGEHADTDGDSDHVCDYCYGDVGEECYDNDKNHYCDECNISMYLDQCVDADKDHKCDYGCDKIYGTHADTDNDHSCDYGCSVAIGTCEDTDKDHKCDYGCDKTYGTHEDTNKDHACDYGCKETIGTCEDTDKDHKCDYGCDNVYGTHEDTNKDHACDYGCKETIGTCEDTDKDHACDYGCGQTYGEHVDTDKDHVCDYGCKETIGTHEDTDNDHACDYGCKETIGTCEDTDKDHKCDYGCDKSYGTHEDTDKDHACDYGCEESIGIHEDTNKDHACDYGCAESIGTHEDTNKDHACDYGCKEAIGTCQDTNFDHACDYGCDKVHGDHADGDDKDHLCDYCGGDVGESCYDSDNDGDHKCDECGDENVTTCGDNDTNHTCDTDSACTAYNTGDNTCRDKNFDHACDYGCTKYFGEHKDSSEDGDHVCDYGCNEILEKCEDCAWNYTNNGDGTHDAFCSICHKQMLNDAKHVYDENGLCVCGNTAEAKIGDKYYYTFLEAVEAAEDGDTVTLLKSVTLTQGITISDKAVTINAVEGAVIATTVTDVFTVTSGGTLTLGEGLVVNSNTSILYANGGTINVDGAILTATGSAYAVAFADASGAIHVISGEINAVDCVGVTVSASGATVNISGGTVTSNSSSAVVAKDNGVVNISGGEVKTTAEDAYCAAFARNGVVNVTGGTVSSANGYGLVAVSDGTVTVSGGTVNGGVLAHENANANATISGGVINGHVGVNNSASMSVTGGSFTMDVTMYCDAEHHTVLNGEYYVYGVHTDCTWNYVDNGNGSHDATCSGCNVSVRDDELHIYDKNGECPCGNTAEAKIGETYYYTFLEAVAAAKDGETVTLLKDVELDSAINISDKAVTITAANGAVITTSVVDVFTVTSGGTLTLGDGLVVNSTTSILYANGGTINVNGATLTATGSAYAVAYADDSGVINVISGEINAVDCVGVTVSASGATVNISGGTVTSNSSSAVVAKDNGVVNISGGEVKTTADDAYCAAFARNGVVNVIGGTVSSENGYGLVAVSDGTVTVSGGTVNGGVLAHENANAKAAISGGTIIGHVGVNNGASMSVTGGSFTMDVTEYCGYMYHTVKPEDGEYYVYGEHVYVKGRCACGHVQDLGVSVVIKAEGADDYVLPIDTVKYGADFSVTPDFSQFHIDCLKLGDVTVKVGGQDVPFEETNGTLTIKDEHVTGHIEIVVNAVQRHVVGEVRMENYVAPSFEADGSYDLVVYCQDCRSVIKKTHYEIEDSQMTAVAQIGDTRYETLDEAIAAANVGDTIVLLQQVAVEGSKVWDLTGITLQIADAGYDYGLIVRGELTINGGTFNGHISVAAGGKLTISGGNFSENVIYTDGENHTLADYLAAGYCLAEANGRYTVAQHIAGEVKVENVENATCTQKGSYDNATYCVHCSKEMSRETVPTPVIPHTEGKVEFSWNILTNEGTAYWTCVDCGTAFDIETQTTSAIVEGNCVTRSQTIYTATAIHNNTVYTSTYVVYGACGDHLAGETKVENVVDATCTTEGSYDNATYCVHCSKEMSRETIETDMLAHTEGAVQFSWNFITNVGTAYWTCVDCGTKFDIETQTTSAFVEGNCVTRNQTVYTATAIHNNTVYTSTYVVYGAYGKHLAGEVKVEKVVNATCTTTGSYDNATYCVHCGEEMSRETVPTPVIPHTEGKVEFSWKLLTNEGTAYWTCVDCGTKFDIETQTTSAYVEGNCVTSSQTIYTATAIHNNTVYSSTYVVYGACGDHLAGETKVENVINATCTTEGSYDNVTYCVHCGEEMSRQTIAVEKLAHTASKVEKENSKAPTCTKSGSYENVTYCACGKELSREVITVAATGHTVGKVVTDKYVAPTCTTAGSYDMVLYCGTCGDEISRTPTTVAATGHKYVLNTVAPTCTQTGYTTYTCACGHKYTADHTAATGHSYEEKITVEPTCEEKGVKTRTCSTCGNVKTEEIAATGHSYTSTVTAPTCTTEGYTTHTCACGYSYNSNFVEANGHSWNAGETEIAPTCTGSGKYTRTCTVCGATDSKLIEANGHSYQEVVTAPTCTEGGYTTHTCSECGDSYVDNKLAANGHSWNEGIITKPTCTADGYTTYTCSTCGISRVDDYVDATGHNYKSVVTAPTCTGNGYTTYTCDWCNHVYVADEVNYTGHSYETVVTPPTCEGMGYSTHTCTVCGDVKRDEIPAAGHNYVAEVTPPTCTAPGYVYYECSECGDFYYGDDLPIIDHTYEAVVTAPTCTEKGYTTYTCACGDSYVDDEVEMIEHTWVNGVVTAPTCTEAGYTTYTCSECGQTHKTDEAAATGHTIGTIVMENYKPAGCVDAGGYTMVIYCAVCDNEIARAEGVIEATGHSYVVVDTAPTCTEGGYTTHTCACGDSYVDNKTDALGHSYTGVTTAPTCTEGGYTTYTCDTCGHSYVDNKTDALGHSYTGVTTAPTCTEGGYTTYTCDTCGHSYVDNKTDALGHSYTGVTTAPTCTEGGYTTYTCACGHSYVDDETDALGHTDGETVKEYAEDGSYYDEVVYCSKCGEELSRTKVEIVVVKSLLGDVDFDGDVDIMDANLVAAYYNERIEFTAEQIAAGDVDGDGDVDIMDANLIAAYYNERIDKFPAEE